MKSEHGRAEIIIVGPGRGAQGGIARVIENYQRTRFWTDYACVQHASTTDRNSKYYKLIHDFYQWIVFSFRLLGRSKPLAVSIHTAHDASFYRKFAYVLSCALARVPSVVHVHPAKFAEFASTGSRFRQWAMSYLGKFADQIVVLTASIRESLADIFPNQEIQVLGNPVDIKYYSKPASAPRNERPRILFLGWITREKGVYDLASSIPQVRERFPNVIFTFAGNQEIEVLQSQLSRENLGNWSEVVGWVEGDAKLELLHTSQVLVLPSYTEGVPNVILEAMSACLPIITTPVGGLPDILTHEENAFFVSPGDIDGISNAIIRLLDDEELRRSMASAARLLVEKNFSIDAIDHGLRNIYGRYKNKTSMQMT